MSDWVRCTRCGWAWDDDDPDHCVCACFHLYDSREVVQLLPDDVQRAANIGLPDRSK